MKIPRLLSQKIALSRLAYKRESGDLMETFETVIIGGGIAGLIAAVYLAKAGISTVVIEKGNRRISLPSCQECGLCSY